MPTHEEIARGADKGSSNKNSGRGSVNNRARLSAFAEARGQGGADWAECDPQMQQEVIARISRMGGAVTFGLSRDRGAYSLTLLLDKERQTLWFNGEADLDAELEKVVATLETLE